VSRVRSRVWDWIPLVARSLSSAESAAVRRMRILDIYRARDGNVWDQNRVDGVRKEPQTCCVVVSGMVK